MSDLRTSENLATMPASPQRMSPLGLAAISFGFFMVLLDASVVNVALPAMQHELQGSIEGLQWVVNSYTLVFASLILSAGALGDRLGHRRIFLWGFLIFTGASLLCSFASSLAFLIVARVLQGIGPALLVPSSLSLILHGFDDPKERAHAIGIWGGSSSIGLACGPVIGGILVGTLGWRSIFLLNVPIGILAIVLVLRTVSETRQNTNRGVDPTGQLLAVIALATLTYALIQGRQQGWNTLPILTVLAVFVIALGLFLAVERRQVTPMLPLRFFSSSIFSTATIVGMIVNFGLYGTLFVLSLFFQDVTHYSAALTGIVFLPLTVAVALNALFSGRATARFGARWPMIIGLATACLGAFLLIPVEQGLFLYIGESLVGLGCGMTVPAMTATLLAAAPKELSGVASATLNASRQIGGVIGVAVLGALLGPVTDSSSVTAGIHVALGLVAVLFFTASLLSLLFISPERAH